MEHSEFKFILMEMIIAIKDKSEYLKTIDASNSLFSQDDFDGMAFAYYKVMDEVFSIAKRFDLKLDEFGLENYNPVDILDYKPLNFW